MAIVSSSEGYKIQWSSTPIPRKTKPLRLSQGDQEAVNAAVKQFMEAGIIERSPSQNKDYLSNLFTVQEKTKRRPILDCQRLNTYIRCQHFNMEGIPALREIIEKNDYLTKIDLKDAYVVVPINESYRRFITFLHEGIV